MEWHPGRETKKYTHKVERQKNKEVLDEEQSYSDIDNYLDDE